MKNRFMLSLVASAMVAGSATAQVTTYGDQAGFSAAAGSVATETFQSCPGATTQFSGSVSSSSGPCGGILAGVTFSPQPTGELYIAGAGQSTNPTTALGQNFPDGAPIDILFSAGTTALGLNLFQNFGGGSQASVDAQFTIALFGLGNSSLGVFNAFVSPNGGDYFGLTSIDTIFRAEVTQLGGYAVIDNVSFSLNSAVPEPSTWAMMLLGFGGIGYSMRRRRKSTAVAQFA